MTERSLPIPLTLFLWLLPALLLFSRAIADATVVLVGVVFLSRSYQLGDWRWAQQGWFRLALLFWAYLLLINVPLSTDTLDSLKYALAFMRWPLFAAALAYWLLSSDRAGRAFLSGLLLTGLFVVLDTGWQYLFGVDWFGMESGLADRLTGPFRNPVPGTLMLRVWFIALFAVFFWQFKSPRQQLMILLAALLLGLVFMFITGERMALILFSSAALLVLSAMCCDYREQRLHLLTGLGLMLAAVLLLMQFVPATTERSVLSIIDKLADFRSSDYGQVFAAAWQVWQQHMWFGSGLHSYQPVCEQMGVLASSTMQCTHPHNLYLLLAAETGVLGLVLFILMLIAIYLRALKMVLLNQYWLHAALSLSVLTVSFWPLSGGISVFNNWIGALVWLGVGWVLAVATKPLTTRSPPTADPDS